MIKQTSIVNGWPDALRCGMGSVPGQVFILHGVSPRRDATLGAIYIQVFPPGDRAVSFLPDGIYASRSGHDESSKGCEGKSIQQLYEEERAFNFVTSKEQDFSGQTSMVAGWPDAIRCGSDATYASGCILMLHGGVNGTSALYSHVSIEQRDVLFGAEGGYLSRVGLDDVTKGCKGKSILQLYNEGRAFNFVTSKWPSAHEMSNGFSIILKELKESF